VSSIAFHDADRRPRIAARLALSIAASFVILAVFGARVFGDVRINEILASNRETVVDDEGESSDWVELVNTGAEAVDLDGWHLSDDPTAPTKWTLPAVSIGPGEHLMVWCSGKDRTTPTSDAITRADSSLVFTPTVIDHGGAWKYLTGPAEEVPPPDGWATVGFDDSTWSEGSTPIGFGEEGLATELPLEIGTTFLRRSFRVDDPATLRSLVVDAMYDDGFVAFLNGVRVLDVNYSDAEDPNFASHAKSGVEKRRARFDLSDRRDLLASENVLAIALLNLRASSTDLLLEIRVGTVPPTLHTNFSIAREGDDIFLTDPSGEIIDVVRMPVQETDRSYGRFPNASGGFVYMLFPTPGIENDAHVATDPIPNEIVTSVPSSGQARAFTVELSANMPFEGFEIRYTLTGDVPTERSTLYEGPIDVRRDMSLRARGFIGTQPVTSVTTRSYFGLAANTRNLTLPVLSITMPVRDYQFVHNSTDARGRTSERRALLEIFNARGEHELTAGMGLRLHGGAGRGGDFATKKAYKVYFRGDYGTKKLEYPLIPSTPVQEFDKLILRSNFNDAFRTGDEAAYIRDQVLRDLHAEMNGVISHGAWYNLIVNGQFRGVYNVVERMDKVFFASYFEEDGENWDVIKTGNDVLDGDGREWAKVRSFFSRSDMRVAENYAAAWEEVDVPDFTAYMILNIWSQNHDWPHNNWYAARPRRDDGRWIFLMWDAEFGLGRVPGGFTSDTFAHVFSRGDSTFTVILQSLLRSPAYQEYFLAELDRHLTTTLAPDNVIRWVDEHANIVRPDMTEESALTGRQVSRWETNINALRQFARGRNDPIRNFILGSNSFTFPRATSVSPRTLTLESEIEVTVRGTRFTSDTTVLFGDLPSPRVEFVDSRNLKAVVPFDIRLVGQPTVTVESPRTGRSTTNGILRVQFRTPKPDRLDPDTAAADDVVHILGADFTEVVRVEFGGVPAPSVVRVGGGSELLAVVVPQGSGTVEVRVINTRPADLPAEGVLTFNYGASAGPRFVRGDSDSNGVLNISDALSILRYLTAGDLTPPCIDAMDADDSSGINITDAIAVLGYLFLGADAPPAPFPDCGRDSSEDVLPCDEAPFCASAP
jgi:hypothetical protein